MHGPEAVVGQQAHARVRLEVRGVVVVAVSAGGGVHVVEVQVAHRTVRGPVQVFEGIELLGSLLLQGLEDLEEDVAEAEIERKREKVASVFEAGDARDGFHAPVEAEGVGEDEEPEVEDGEVAEGEEPREDFRFPRRWIVGGGKPWSPCLQSHCQDDRQRRGQDQ